MLGRLRTSTLAIGIGIAGIATSGAWGSAGCTATKPTELVPGALTQVNIPKSLAGLRVQVYVNGTGPAFDQFYTVSNGIAFLPATLGVVSAGNATTRVEIIIAGFDQAGVSCPQWQDGTQALGAVGNPPCGPRVKRASIQTYVDQRTLFLPMNLSYSCWGQDCEGDAGVGAQAVSTCKAASCVDNVTDPHTLVDFDPSLIDGTQDCFSPSKCFTPVVTAEPVDPDNCTYTVPPGETNGPGLNVRVIYQDLLLPDAGAPYNDATSEQEILNLEPNDPAHNLPLEGYSIPDSNKPFQFQLGAGLCSLVKAFDTPPPGVIPGSPKHYHTISAVQVSTTCPSKPPLLPICAPEQNKAALGADGGPSTGIVCDQPITLVQAPSAIYMVMDDSSIMSGAFGSDGYATAMGLALGNPLFKRTYVAFEFMDHNLGDCALDAGTPYAMPGSSVPDSVDFTVATLAQPKIAKLLLNPPFPEPVLDAGQPAGGFKPLVLEGAMRLDVGAFKHLSDFATGLKSNKDQLEVGAVMFFVNRQSVTTAQPITFIDGGLTMVPTSQYTPPIGQDCYQGINDGGTAAQTTLEQQIIAADAVGLQTYFVVLNNGLYQVGTPIPFFDTIKAAVAAQGVKTMQVIDATADKSHLAEILGSFSNTATALGTCLYELPLGVDTNANLSFTVPVPIPASLGLPASVPTAPTPIPIKPDSTCSAATQDTANGWSIDTGHIRVCGGACTELRGFVEATTAAVLATTPADAGSPTIPEVPVTVVQPCVHGGT